MRLFRQLFRKSRKQVQATEELVCNTLEDRILLSTVQLIAAGQEGGEQMELLIDGAEVQAWTLGAGAANGQFQTYTYNTPDIISADQIRIQFSNDLYDPANNFDRNVRVDAIVVDGQRFETEDPSVFSTGTWVRGVGIQPGNLQSEVLHSNGYFQYADTTNSSGIVIRARGDEGVEQFNLLIDEVVVANYSVSTSYQDYSYTAPSVTADQIRIEFLNDEYNPSAGIDNNLVVDYIRIDGATYQTEAPTTYSTGTWRPGIGVEPGFLQAEKLMTEGYFQYLATPANSGTIGLGVTQLTVDEDSGAVQIAIQRTGGSDGVATAFYQTLGVEATDGSDFVGNANGQVTFADGQTTAFATVALINDDALEAAETFSVSLFRTVGAQLGVPRTAIVTIVDDESGEGLVGHWRLDETAIGQSVGDSSGEGNNGVHNNFQTPDGPVSDTPNVDSPNPRGLSFDGTNDFVSIDPDAALNLNGSSFTQSVWIKPEVTDDGYHGVVGYQGAGGAANRYPGIWVYQQNRIHAGFGDGTNWNRFNTGEVLTTGEWNHVATTFDGTTYRAFVNGIAVFASTEFAGRTPTSTTQVDIGRVDNYFEGNIDDVRIYNRALTASEISVLIDGADVPDVPINGEFTANELVSGFDTPIEVEWLPDGRMLVAEQDGFVRVVNTDGTVQSTPLLDITSIVNSGTKDRGMIGFAVHPDFANNPYIYASYTYDPPEVNGNTGLGGPDGNGARVSRISRFTVNAAGTFADPNSNVVLVGNNSVYENIGDPNIRPGLNDPHSCIDVNGNPVQDCIPIDETSHTIGELQFGPDGNLYAASGDAGSFGRVDPINLRALDIDSLAGKILRIDPITGDGPSDNPFYDGDPDSNQSKVFVYGVRNPFRFALNDDANSPQIFIGDVGWTQWEEINAGTGGENFGWPAFEGGSDVSLQTGGYRDLAEVQAYYATNPDVTAPIWGRLHSDGGRAIVMGDFASSNYAGQEGKLIFTDIGDQVLRAASFDASGNLTGVAAVSQQLGFIVDMETGPDGYMYYIDITGSVGRLDFVIA